MLLNILQYAGQARIRRSYLAPVSVEPGLRDLPQRDKWCRDERLAS